MFTLDGRMRFQINLAPEDEDRFLKARLQEIVLRGQEELFTLSFGFGELPAQDLEQPAEAFLPHYVLLQQDGGASDVQQDPVISQIFDARKRVVTQVGDSQ